MGDVYVVYFIGLLNDRPPSFQSFVVLWLRL